MTHNQINYWTLQENKRHNVSTEGETVRHNVVTEGETNRHNVATENETHRHNVTTEGIDLGKLNETQRHNLVTEGQTNFSLSEQQRHNIATEQLSAGNLAVSEYQAQTGRQQVGISASAVAETSRHNQAMEGIQSLLASSQAELQSAQSRLTAVNAEWQNKLNMNSSQYTDAQIDKINSEISINQKRLDEISATINNINSQTGLNQSNMSLNDARTEYQKLQNQTYMIDEMFKGIDSLSRSVRNLKGGKLYER